MITTMLCEGKKKKKGKKKKEKKERKRNLNSFPKFSIS